MMRTVHLHGWLKDRFGPSYRYDIESVGEAGRALAATVPGFREACIDKTFRVIIGPLERGLDIATEELSFLLGKCEDVHIIPVFTGAKDSMGIVKVVVGVALVALAFAGGVGLLGSAHLLPQAIFGLTFPFEISWGSMAMVGLAIALSGASQLLASSPKNDYDNEQPDSKTSFIITNPVNTMEQGGAIPVIYGRVRVGSVVVSAGLSTEDI